MEANATIYVLTAIVVPDNNMGNGYGMESRLTAAFSGL
jgi:hypothetical protein